MQSMNQSDSNDRSLKGSNKWWKDIIAKKKTAEMKLIQHEFDTLITLKFSNIKRGSCLMPEQIEKLVTDDLQLQKKKLFL